MSLCSSLTRSFASAHADHPGDVKSSNSGLLAACDDCPVDAGTGARAAGVAGSVVFFVEPLPLHPAKTAISIKPVAIIGITATRPRDIRAPSMAVAAGPFNFRVPYTPIGAPGLAVLDVC
jgi:hypothetical protein